MRGIDIRSILQIENGDNIRITTIDEEEYELPKKDVQVLGETVELTSKQGTLYLQTEDIEKIWIM